MTRALTLLLGTAIVLLAGFGSADQFRMREAAHLGDPDKPGSPFVMRFRYHGVVRIPPHWHPTDEHIAVLRGKAPPPK